MFNVSTYRMKFNFTSHESKHITYLGKDYTITPRGQYLDIHGYNVNASIPIQGSPNEKTNLQFLNETRQVTLKVKNLITIQGDYNDYYIDLGNINQCALPIEAVNNEILYDFVYNTQWYRIALEEKVWFKHGIVGYNTESFKERIYMLDNMYFDGTMLT